MNTKSPPPRWFSGRCTTIGSIILLALGLAPVAAIADQGAVTAAVSRVADVSLADLNLSTPAGMREAHERLETMAQRLCAELARSHELAYQPSYGTCVHDTLAGALAQVNAIRAAKDTRTAQHITP